MDTSTWLITGASSGLGYALADYVLNQGERVVLATKTLDATADLAERHPDTGCPRARRHPSAARRRHPTSRASVDMLTVKTVNGEAIYTGTYRCTLEPSASRMKMFLRPALTHGGGGSQIG